MPSTPPPTYPQSKLALLNAQTVAAAWAALALLSSSLLALKAVPDWSGPALIVIAPVLLLLVAAHIFLSLRHRCPSCGKHPAVQGFNATHTNAARQSALDGWSGAVVNILRRRRLVCIHCGQQFRIDA